MREGTGPEGERGGKNVGGKGPRKRTRKTLILVPYDLGTLQKMRRSLGRRGWL